MKKVLYIVLAAALLGGCSTAGPFVTSISSDGRGSITVEKGMVRMDGFSGTVSNSEAMSSQTIRVCDCPSTEKR